MMNESFEEDDPLRSQLLQLSAALRGPRSSRARWQDVSSEACVEICCDAEVLAWRDIDQRTALHLACELGLQRAAGYIIEKGGQRMVETGDATQSMPLHEAARAGSVGLVQMLLGNGARAESADRSGVTPLHHAASGGHVEVLTLLQQHGASVEAYSGVGTPLHWAAGEGQCSAIEKLIGLGSGINTLDCEGVTPLGMAAVACQEEAACLLLDSGAKPVISRFPCGMTELHVAAELGMDRFVRRLLQTPEGAAACRRLSQGRLPVHVAVANGHEGIAEMLLPVSGLSEGTDMQTLLREAAELDGSGSDDDGGGWGFATSAVPSGFGSLRDSKSSFFGALDDGSPSAASMSCTPPAVLRDHHRADASSRLIQEQTMAMDPLASVHASPSKRPKQSDNAMLSPSRIRISQLKLCAPKKRSSQLRLSTGSRDEQEGDESGGPSKVSSGHISGLPPMLPPLKRPLKLTLNVKRTLNP